MNAKRKCRKCGGTGKELDPTRVGHEMRRLRKKKGIGLRDMAKRMDISAPYLSDLELGRRDWTEEKIAAFKGAL
jgi:transcriptional regulator with XRE-family HTH domain